MTDWRESLHCDFIQSGHALGVHLLQRNQVILSMSSNDDDDKKQHQAAFQVKDTNGFFDLFQVNHQQDLTRISVLETSKELPKTVEFIIACRPTLNSVIALSKQKIYSLLVYRLHSELVLCVFVMKKQPNQMREMLKLAEKYVTTV